MCFQHILCSVVFGLFLSSSCVLCMMVSNTYCALLFLVCFCLPKTNQKEKSTICVGYHHTQDTRRRQTQTKNNRAQYVLDTIIHKTQDEDKNKPKTTEHNMCYDVQHILCSVVFGLCLSSSCVLCMMMFNTYCALLFLVCVCLPKTNQKQQSTICVGHHHTQDTRRRQKQTKNNRAQYVLDIIDDVQHILCSVVFGLFLSSSCVLCMMVSNTYCALLFLVCVWC
jgi:hypothetical protein